MKLTKKEIEHLAKLSRLELSEQEKTLYAEQLSVILNYIEQLNEVNTKEIEETCQVTGLKNVMREDEIIECDKEVKDKITEQFPKQKNGMLKVKQVFN